MRKKEKKGKSSHSMMMMLTVLATGRFAFATAFARRGWGTRALIVGVSSHGIQRRDLSTTLHVKTTSTSSTDISLEGILEVAVQAAKKAGAIIRSNAGGANVVETKSTSRDLLTLVDPQCEKAIYETVQSAFPHHSFLGEEQVASGIEASVEALEEKLAKNTASDYLWIVDPIDGTTNFASGIPLSAPSIAVASNGAVVVGVIYDPHRDECYAAMRGKGTFLNGKRIHVDVTHSKSIGDAIVGMESPAGAAALETALQGVGPMMRHARSVRMLGASAIMLPWVAAHGRLTAYWTPDECAWDIAAGSLIVQEAGGTVTDLSGNPYTLRTRKLLASNGLVHQEILRILNKAGIN